MNQGNMAVTYPSVELLIAGKWRGASDGSSAPVINPATEEEIGRVPTATERDLDEAVQSSARAFQSWRRSAPYTRYKVMREAARLLAQRSDDIGRVMTLEQGKPIAQAQSEAANGAEIIDWFAEEARRISDRIIPARVDRVEQRLVREPVGPVAAFTPWNFPVNQAVRKICAAVAAGCTIVLKGPEDTPASCAALVKAFTDAGLPDGVINLVYGDPARISSYLIAHPVIRKVSFTGSTAVGKQLAALAGSHMKPTTMELGGHGPVLVFGDADIDRTVKILSGVKFRNAGQVCTSPTRYIVHEDVKVPFLAAFTEAASKIRVGNGMDPEVEMGPLAHARRLIAMETLVADAVLHGGRIETGGRRVGNRGYFFEPTVIADTPTKARIMSEEPFGPIALVNGYRSDEEMLAEANRLPYGLASYAYTGPSRRVQDLAQQLDAGMVSINHHNLGLPEVPFGGVRDSGHGNEGGAEALNAYLVDKYVTHYAL